MPTYAWTGLGVADGVSLTSGNGNAVGNGSPLTVSVSGTSTNPYVPGANAYRLAAVHDGSGDGFSVQGQGASSIARMDLIAVGGAELSAVSFELEYGGPPTGTACDLLVGRSNTAAVASSLNLTVTGTLRVSNSAGVAVTSAVSGSATTSTSPALITGHKYAIDFAMIRNTTTTPSTTNGRLMGRVRDLGDPTWNSTGEWYFDSGYTVNVTIDKPDTYRVGKTGAPSTLPQQIFRKLRWYTTDAPQTSLVKATALGNFVPLTAPSVSTTNTGDAYLIVATGTSAGGGALTYSIAQTAGSAFTPILLAPGVWKVARDTAGSRTYDVTTVEAAGGTAVTTYVVPLQAAVTASTYQRLRRVGGAWV